MSTAPRHPASDHPGPASRDRDARHAPTVPLWREAVGAVLRSARLKLGHRLVDVAGDAGVSPQYLSEVERGRKDPSSEMLAAISGALGLDVGTVAGRAAATVRAADARATGTLLLELRSDVSVARRAPLGVGARREHTASGRWSAPGHGATVTASAYLLAA